MYATEHVVTSHDNWFYDAVKSGVEAIGGLFAGWSGLLLKRAWGSKVSQAQLDAALEKWYALIRREIKEGDEAVEDRLEKKLDSMHQDVRTILEAVVRERGH